MTAFLLKVHLFMRGLEAYLVRTVLLLLNYPVFEIPKDHL